MARILIVDDEVYVVGALRRLLRREGFAIEVALNGEEALEKLSSFEADLVISDYLMPGMDGLALFGEVRRLLPRAIRVLISGHAEFVPGSFTQPGAEAISHFIPKPWNDERLLAELRALLGKRLPPPSEA